MEKTIRIELSKREIPCLWEEGGAGSTTGSCTLIGDKNCNPKKPIYVATKGHLSNGNHALIPVKVNDIVVECSQWRNDIVVKCSQWRHDYTINIYKIVRTYIEALEKLLESYTINIYKIVSFNMEEKEATLKLVNSFDRNEWDFYLLQKYVDIVETAKSKARSYHCRNPYFIKE